MGGPVDTTASTSAAAAGAIVHGGDLDAARRRFPGAPEPWIDLSTGINPRPWPVPALPGEVWSRLPAASQVAGLLAAAAAAYGVGDPGWIVAAPGTQALIQLLPRLMPAGRVAVIGPTYQEHEASWSRQGHAVAVVPDLAAAEGADVVVLVNPDNPTGRLVHPQALRPVARRLAGRGGLLVVDEAFVDLLPPAASLAPDLPPATVVLRSFGKTWGLAGLRLGFAIAEAAMAARIAEELGPWAVCGPALAIGRAALEDRAWLAKAGARLARDGERLDAMLAGAGLAPLGGTPLFRLVGHPGAEALADRLGRHGILVRTFPAAPDRLRLGLPGAQAAWARLAAALSRP